MLGICASSLHESGRTIREALERRGIVFSNGSKPGVYLDNSKAIIPV